MVERCNSGVILGSEEPGRLPARRRAEQAAWVLGWQPHDVLILVAAPLLEAPESVKCVAASELLELVEDRAGPAKVTIEVNQHRQMKTAAKKNRPTMDGLAQLLSRRRGAENSLAGIDLGFFYLDLRVRVRLSTKQGPDYQRVVEIAC